MITSLLTVLFVIVLAVFAACIVSGRPPPARDPVFDIARMMEAIAAVENSKHYEAGPSGERSIYQITQTVWEAHSGEPFILASVYSEDANREIARVVRRHIQWIRERRHHLHLEGSEVYQVALVWKAGYSRCLAKKIRPVDYDYAARCENVYNAP